MLQDFRKISHGWVAWVIFALIAIVFALFGVEGLRMNSGSSDTVTIGGETVSRSLIKSMERYFPQFNTDRALEINSKLDSLGFYVTEEQISDAIVRLPAFQENGKFSVELYKKIMGYEPNYLYGLRKIIAIELKKQQLADLFITSSLSKSSVDKAYELFNESRNAEVLTVPYKKYLDKVSISDIEIKNYFDKHKSNFISPEKIKLEYVLFDKKDLIKNVHIPESELLNYYNQNKSSYIIPERREVAQIVLNNSNKKDLELIEKSLSKDTNDFANLAKKYSEGINAKKGGNIGFFQKDDMESKALDNAIFSIEKKDAVSKPVVSDDKVYIFKVLKIKPEIVKPFAEVKNDLKASLEKDYINNKYIEKRDEIANKIYEIPDSLQELAKDYHFDLNTTNWISKNNFIIKDKDSELFQKNLQEIYKASFSEDVLNNGNNSELLELSNNKIMVLRIAKYEPSKQQNLNEVKSEIIADLKELKAQEKANKLVIELEKDIKNGKPLKVLSAKNSIEYKAYNNLKWADLANKNDANLSASLIDKIFSMPVPNKGKDSNLEKRVITFQDADGNSKVIVLDKVVLAEAAKASKKQLDEIKVLLAQSVYMMNNVIFWNEIAS